MIKTRFLTYLLAGLASLASFTQAAPLGTGFTYQGRLDTSAGAATGRYDFQFSLWTVASGPAQVGNTLSLPATPVTNGQFTVILDFGTSPWAGDACWLEIAVRTNGGAVFATLSPRQSLTPSPYAMYARNAGSASSANYATGAGTAAVANNVSPGAVTGASIADGQVVKSLNGQTDAVTIHGGANIVVDTTAGAIWVSSPATWSVKGNGGTVPGTDFLGTIDNKPLEFKVNGQRALRLEPQPEGEDNLIAGAWVNTVALGAVGSTISGGGSRNRGGNYIHTDFATIGGGYGNQIATNAVLSTISGGSANLIFSNAFQSTIGGGFYHRISEDAFDSTIAGGWQNWIERNASGATIAGGTLNTIHSNAFTTTIGGGGGNHIDTNAYNSTIAGGVANHIEHDSASGVIGGGQQNHILPYVNAATIGGGSENTNSGSYATVPGGAKNFAMAAYSFAAGRRAGAVHPGAFVWADSTDADFTSTANNQFLIRANGNVGINKSNPGTALDVNGTITASGFTGPGSGLTGVGTASIADNSITAAKLASDAASLAKITAGRITNAGNRLIVRGSGTIDTSLFTGLSFQHETSQGEGAIMSAYDDGFSSLSFWTKAGSGQPITKRLTIDRYGNTTIVTNLGVGAALVVDNASINDGTIAPGLTFGASSGEGIASKRTAGGNQFGLDFYTGGSARLSIDNVGRVGIGTMTPSDATLDVRGDIRLSDTQLLLRGGTDRNHGLSWFTSGGFAGVNPDGPVLYGCGGGGLGTVCGGQKLSLSWNSSARVIVDPGDLNTGSLATSALVFGAGVTGEGIASKRSAGGNQNGLDLYTGSAARLSIANGGNVGVGRVPTANKLEVEGNASKTAAGSWLANSDARIKEDIQPISGALDKLSQVRLVSFRYTDDYRRQHPSVEDRAYLNVVAQEFQKVFPEAVKQSGEKLANGDGILQVDTYPLTIYSAAAVQELQQQLKGKDARIAELEKRLERIERRLNQGAPK